MAYSHGAGLAGRAGAMSWRTRSITLTLLAVAAAGAAIWQRFAARGHVQVRGEVDGAQVSEVAQLDHFAIHAPEHFLVLERRGRVAFFGDALVGSTFMRRSAGERGVWQCGRVTGGRFGGRDGALLVDHVATVLDEGSAPRGGQLDISGLRLGPMRRACRAREQLEGEAWGALRASRNSYDPKSRWLSVRLEREGSAADLEIAAELASHIPADQDGVITISYAWVRELPRQGEVRVYASGPGSRVEIADGCARLELRAMTEPGVCRREGGDRGDHLDVTW